MLGAVGPRAAASPMALPREGWISPLEQSTTRLSFFRRLLRFHGTCHVELYKFPKLRNTKRKTSFKILLVEFGVIQIHSEMPA